MNAIYTLDVDNALSPHARQSQQAAAERWGCDYRVLSEWPGARKDTFGGKLQFHLLKGERCLWLDADVLIRSDCPSLFDIVPETHIGGVPCSQDERTAEAEELTRSSWADVSAMLGVCDVEYDWRSYINGGVILWTPAEHSVVWEWLDERVYRSRVGPMVEQTCQNIAIAHLEMPLETLSREFNRVGPHVWEHFGPMDAYVYHFAAWQRYRGERQKREAMERCEWNVSQ